MKKYIIFCGLFATYLLLFASLLSGCATPRALSENTEYRDSLYAPTMSDDGFGRDGETAGTREICLSDSITLRIRQISEEEYTPRKQAAAHLRHKPYKKIEDLTKARRMLGKRLRVIDREYEEKIIPDFEITLPGGDKRHLNFEFVFVAYYPEIKVLLFDTEGGYYSVDFRNNAEEYDVSPDNHSISPDRRFRINAECPNNLAKEDYSCFIDMWNGDTKRYERVGDLFSVWGYDLGWTWTDNNTVLFTYIVHHQTEKDRIYLEAKINVEM